MASLEAALQAQDMAAAMTAVPWDALEEMQMPVSEELSVILNKSGEAAARGLVTKGIDIAFDTTNPNAVNWAKQHAAELVMQNIIPQSQEAIRDIIVRAFQEGIPPREAARLIREVIGILPAHADAVEKYRQELMDKFKGFGYPDWQAQADRLAARYAQQLINYRANNIARTETIRAANRGQHELWNQAVDKGLLRKAEWVREWIADETERTCPICQALNGQRVPLDGVFPGGYDMPPAHPSCRCSIGLVRILE